MDQQTHDEILARGQRLVDLHRRAAAVFPYRWPRILENHLIQTLEHFDPQKDLDLEITENKYVSVTLTYMLTQLNDFVPPGPGFIWAGWVETEFLIKPPEGPILRTHADDLNHYFHYFIVSTNFLMK